jgi:hypothetical protein
MKKFFIALMGGTVLLIGIALLVLPGPGLPIMAAGIAILATEFLWARRVWRQAKGAAAKARRRFGLRGWRSRGFACTTAKRRPSEE